MNTDGHRFCASRNWILSVPANLCSICVHLWPKTPFCSVLIVFVFLAMTGKVFAADNSTNVPPAKLKVSGYGLLGNLRLKTMLDVLREGKEKPEFYNASYIEDAALLLVARLRDDGYLKPLITARVTLENGQHV